VRFVRRSLLNVADPRTADQNYWTASHKKNATCPKTYAMCDANEVIGPEIVDLLSWASVMGQDTDKDLCVTLALMAGAPTGLSNAFCGKTLNIMCEVNTFKKLEY